MSGVLFLATVETRNFSFDGVGRTEAEAVEACRLAWEAHRARCGGLDDLYDWESDLRDGCYVRKLSVGGSYIDTEEVKP